MRSVFYDDYRGHDAEHQKEHTRLVKKILKAIVRARGVDYQRAHFLLVNQDIETTLQFWEEFWKTEEGRKYNLVCFCRGCRRFDLSFDPDAPDFSDYAPYSNSSGA